MDVLLRKKRENHILKVLLWFKALLVIRDFNIIRIANELKRNVKSEYVKVNKEFLASIIHDDTVLKVRHNDKT